MPNNESITPLRLGRFKAGYRDADAVAKIVGVSRNTLYSYERGEHEIPSSVLIKFSKLYRLSTDELLGLTAGG
jgi:predicted transcriptional regulator